jgi:hypothetical protein
MSTLTTTFLVYTTAGGEEDAPRRGARGVQRRVGPLQAAAGQHAAAGSESPRGEHAAAGREPRGAARGPGVADVIREMDPQWIALRVAVRTSRAVASERLPLRERK